MGKPGKKYPKSATREILTRYSFGCFHLRSRDFLEVDFGSGLNILISNANSHHKLDYSNENFVFVANQIGYKLSNS